MIKVGDKVYCIRNRVCNSDHTILVNKFGKSYFIMRILGDDVYISNEENREDFYFYTLNKLDISHYIYERYFINIKETRKQKVQKLQNETKCGN